MFSGVVQPTIVSLFSSTGSLPLQLFRTRLDPSLPADSLVHLLHDQTSLPNPTAPKCLISPPALVKSSPDGESHIEGYALNQTVLQIQSPTLRTTYIESGQPPSSVPSSISSSGLHDKSSLGLLLGIRHPWMHLQVRNMGREWSFEVGIVDQSGRMGILRLSTFQKQPRLKLSTSRKSYPLLHLPLAFPPSSSRPLTAWSTVTLNLPSYLPYFSSSKLMEQENDTGNDTTVDTVGSDVRNARPGQAIIHAIPNGGYSHLAYIRIYATCRLRRIWFDENGLGEKLPWEFELYGD